MGASGRLALSVEGVSHAYGARTAVSDVSFGVAPGSFTALLGPNGAGKSTLISLVNGLNALQRGSIEIGGRSLARDGPRALAPLGIVFQQMSLDLDLTVRQNLAYFAALRGLSRAVAARRIPEVLQGLDLEPRLDERVRRLNGGHRRRVEIARALLAAPRLLLLDEPTVGLDIPTRAAIVDHVHALAREGIAVLWATHLIDEIAPGDGLVVLDKGCVVAAGAARDVIAGSGAATLAGAYAVLTGGKAEAA